MEVLTETRRYSVDELLRLRSSLPVVTCLVRNINQHPDIACIFRIPEEALRRPEQFSCTSAHLTDITNKPVLRQLGRKNVTESSEQSEPRPLEVSRVQGLQPVHWHLRRRENSDRSSQPHSAPSGFAAQQSENFQKFYRAVVSPTHVRVTAGGRIVPNNRSPAPTPSEVITDKNEHELESKFPGGVPWIQDVSSVYSQVPQVPGGSLPPFNLHPQSSAVGFPIMPTPPPGYYGAGAAEQLSKSHLGAQLPGVKPQQIKISPPAQFDQTKPFTYNGQIVYPVPYGHQPPPNAIPLPMGMLGNPNFFPQVAPQPPGLMPSALPFQFANQPNPVIFAPAQQSGMLAMPNGVQGSEPFMPYMPVPGLLLPSDYMKSQLQVLQAHLHQIDTILGSDKNRVDKAVLEQQRTSLHSQIDHMEELLQVNCSRGGTATGVVRRSDNKSGGSHEEHKSTRSVSESLRADTATKTDAKYDNSASHQDLPSKSKLTIAAAMAPPFQPRSRTTVTSAAGQSIQPKHPKHISRSTSAIEDNEPEETVAEITARLMAYSTTDWLRSGFKFGNDRGYDPPKDEVRHGVSHHNTQYEKSRSYQRSSTSHSQAPAMKPNTSAPPSETIPYLIGTLPTGVSAQTANANDLVYSRPLTDDELRARYLYWGKAPRSVQSGLPKFDGKDFYPPSPVKKPASIASVKSVETQVSLEIEPEKTYPFRLPSNDIAYLKPIPQPVFTDAKSRGNSQQSTFTQGLHNGWSRDSRSGHNQEATVGEKVVKSVPGLDFSKLFMEKGCPGYRSPSPKPTVVRFSRDQDEAPVTPENATFFEEAEDEVDDAKSDDSWQPAGRDSQRYKSENGVISVDSTASDTQETESTVEINLSPRANGHRVSPKPLKSFDERVENFKNVDEQTIFLQQMLKNEGRAGTPLMGTISSATAQGFLPQYRGSAAASLTPAEYIPYKSASTKATNSQAENRPFNQDKNERHGVPGPQTAEAYLRQISEQLQETEKSTLDQGWNPNTTRTGPVRPGEEW
ncbi:hypothetical protein ONS95_011490 [Cadophora gregata]|uniref:uncharacterized protein n=1 Tax=Cadophora gregata TaxID=51156 RepID=UPI0026DB52D6|nr:uncharacterized protein ONS95_011490 [Cadophora gregata]KAK0120077.1 hypothetical protein ONS95_011490 [Cadophora gregata]KAK0121108.1 hypothetical protein ONS96_011290 [Cadophora gregata f. sp. sojae]